jgi:hypothetical protein
MRRDLCPGLSVRNNKKIMRVAGRVLALMLLLVTVGCDRVLGSGRPERNAHNA